MNEDWTPEKSWREMTQEERSWFIETFNEGSTPGYGAGFSEEGGRLPVLLPLDIVCTVFKVPEEG